MFFMYSDLQCRPTANRLTANVGHCHRMADMDCRETALKGTEIVGTRCYCHHLNCHSLQTDRDQTCKFCSPLLLSSRYGFTGKYSLWNNR